MDKFISEKTKTTPQINFNPDVNQLEISGESYPENSAEFYKPVLSWIKDYLKTEPDFNFNFKMIYFNTSSSKAIFDILDILEKHFKKSGKGKINWFYESDDEDIMESGEEFAEGLTIPFEIKSY